MPPKSQSTTSPSAITRSLGSWCGLAALAPAATMAKFARSWPPSSMRSTSSRCTSSSVRPANGRSRISARDVVDDRGRGAQRVDLGGVLHHAQRSGDVGGAAERDVGQRALQVEHEPGPGVVADRGGRGVGREADDQPGHERDRVVGLVPRDELERVGLLDDARRLERGIDEHRVAVGAGSTSIVSRSSGIAS